MATSAVREARNSDLFLDRMRGRTGFTFEIINEAEESRLVFLAVRAALRGHAALKGAWTLLCRGRRRQHQPDAAAARETEPLGRVRARRRQAPPAPRPAAPHPRPAGRAAQALHRQRRSKRSASRFRSIASRRWWRSAATSASRRRSCRSTRTATACTRFRSEAFLAFCDEVERLDDDGLVESLPAAGRRGRNAVARRCSIYRALLSQTAARSVVVSDASLRAGMLLDFAEPEGRLGAEDFERQVLASADAVGHRFRFDRAHGHHVAMLATRLFDELRTSTACRDRERLLLQTAACCTTSASTSACARTTSTRSTCWRRRRSSACPTRRPPSCPTSRATTGAEPLRRVTCRSWRWTGSDRLLVNKLAAILRLANALDAEHLQKVRDVRLVRGDNSWLLEIDGSGDITMEQLAATARTDMFVEVFGRQLVVRVAGATW